MSSCLLEEALDVAQTSCHHQLTFTVPGCIWDLVPHCAAAAGITMLPHRCPPFKSCLDAISPQYLRNSVRSMQLLLVDWSVFEMDEANCIDFARTRLIWFM